MNVLTRTERAREATGPLTAATTRCVALTSLALTLAACAPVKQVSVDPGDATPGMIHFGSLNLVPEIGIGAARPHTTVTAPWDMESVTTFPEQSGFDGSVPNPEALVTATAVDAESGIRSVEIAGRMTAWCNPTWNSPTPPRRVDGMLAPVVVGDPNPVAGASGTQPRERRAIVVLRHSELRALCGSEVLTDFEIVVDAVARNGLGLESRSRARVVRPVQVVVHNMWGPCLTELQHAGDRDLGGAPLCSGLHHQQPGTGPGLQTHLNEVLDRWGRYFAKQDIVLLNEASWAPWIDRMRMSMPDHALAYRGSVAIFSRWPLGNVSDRATPAVCVVDVDGTTLCGINAVWSEYVRALVETPRGTMDVMSLHWQHRPVPVTSHPSRVDFARTIVRELLTSNWALVGGDFNSKSVWIASQDELIGGSDEETARMRATHAGMRGRSQPEIAEMESAFTNARREVWENDLSRWSHAFPWPGDFVFLRNRLHAVQYTNDQSGVIGSDHPTIRVLLMRR